MPAWGTARVDSFVLAIRGRSSNVATRGAEVRIRLAVGSVRLEYRGKRAFFERLVLPLVDAAYAKAQRESVVDDAVPVPEGPTFQPSSPPRFNQFTGQVGSRAATVDQRAMAFAFYLWNYERKEEFSVDEIEAFFRTVHEVPPEDMADRISELSDEKRFLEKGREDGAWRLTPKGVNYVKNRLLGEIA